MIRILASGARATIQDPGRFAHLRDGIPTSGPMDPFAFGAANALVGNAVAAAALEIVGLPFSFVCEDRRLVVAALEQSGGNLSEASRRLGISRNTLKARVRLYGL